MRLTEINWIRFYATCCIVIWHCFFCPITCWDILEPTSRTKIIAFWGWVFMPIANMPLFTFISGFLFEFIYNRSEKYKNWRYFVKNKAERLLVPFFVFGSLISISSPEFHLYQMLYGAGSHMWYCTMLFWCFAIAWLLKQTIYIYLTELLALVSIFTIIYFGEDVPKMPFGIHKTLFYFYYFYLGQLVCKYNVFFIKYRKYFVLGIFVVLLLQFYFKFDWYRQLGVIPYTTAFVLILYYLAKSIPEKWFRENGFVSTICSYSFGIYVFHQWISWIVYKTPYFQNIFKENVLSFAISFTVVDFIISILSTNLLLRTKIGKYLLS